MRLVTGFIYPEEESLNRHAIARGERAKGDRETVGPDRPELLEACLAVNCDDTCLLPAGHKGVHTWQRRWTR